MTAPRQDRWGRVGLEFLAANQGVPGLWVALAPRSVYNDFPIPSHRWVPAFSPFNDHLAQDLGTLSVCVAVVLAAAALFLEARLVVIAVLSALTIMVPHTIWHISHLAPFRRRRRGRADRGERSRARARAGLPSLRLGTRGR